jgi:hypothetical protein
MKGSLSCFISRAGIVQVNLVLLHVLDTQFGVRVASEDLIPHLLGDDEGEPFDPSPLYAELIQRYRQLAERRVTPSFELLCTYRLRQAFQILRDYADDTCTRAVNLRN